MSRDIKDVVSEVQDFAAKRGKRETARAPSRRSPSPPIAKRGMVNTPDLREMDQTKAIRTARRQPHLMQDKGGQYIGAPRGVRGKYAIRKMRNKFDEDVAKGAAQADWYDRARTTNVEWAGPDPDRQRLLSDEEALFSAQANPDTNLNFALQAHNAFEMGTPLDKVRTGAQARTYNAARLGGFRVPLGKKTRIYGQHLDPTVDPATTGTNDIWHARGFGFTNKDGKQFSRALSQQEHRFLDYETMLAVDRANRKGLNGRTDWTAGEIQAAPWVAGKGTALAELKFKKGKHYKPPRGHNGGPPLDDPDIDPTQLTPEELEWGLREAGKTYPDYADKYTAFAPYEQTPYVYGGHLEEVARGSDQLRQDYALANNGWVDESGRDILFDDVGFYQRPTLEAQGVYSPPNGALEFNPAKVARPLVGLLPGGGGADVASRAGLDLATAIRSYIDAQGAGAWLKPIANAASGKLRSVLAPLPGMLDPDQMKALMELGERYGLPNVIDTGQGVALTNFGGELPDSRALNKYLKAGSFKNEMGSILNADVEPTRVHIDSNYLPLLELSGNQQGTGVVTRSLRDLFDKYNEGSLLRLDQSAALRQKALENLERDRDFARITGSPAAADIQLGREIFAKEGFPGLFEALDKGVKLRAEGGLAEADQRYGRG